MHAGRIIIIASLIYLSDGSCILDYFNEASVRPSGNAAVRDESEIQPLLLPQLVTVPVGVCVRELYINQCSISTLAKVM